MTNMRRCIIFIITLFVCFEGYSQKIIASEEKIDYSGIDKKFSDMIKSENLLRLKCVSKDISWEYYREKTGREISYLGDVGEYFKYIDRYYNSKSLCLICLGTIDYEFFDHQYLQKIYLLYENDSLVFIYLKDKKSDDFLSYDDPIPYKCSEQKFYFNSEGKCIKALEKKYDYICPVEKLINSDSLSLTIKNIEIDCRIGDSTKIDLIKLFKKY